jgi:hypothetical protein
MVISHYIATPLDDLPEGSVGYMLGRRKAFSKHIKKTLEGRGMTWEKEDPSKATFFIVGDILTKEDNLLNSDLSRPIVMDITLENEWHHKYSGIDYITNVNEKVLTSLFRRGTRKDLDTMSVLLKFVHAESLSNITRTRLALHYVKCAGESGYSYSDLAHKKLIRMMRRLTLPQHQFLLEPKFANAYTKLDYSYSGDSSLIKSSQFNTKDGFSNFGYLGICTGWGREVRLFVPLEDDTLDLAFLDLKEDLQLVEKRSSGYDFSQEFHEERNIDVEEAYDAYTVQGGYRVSVGPITMACNLVYNSPKSEDEMPLIMGISGAKTAKSAYSGLNDLSFNGTDPDARKLISLYRAEIRKRPSYRKINDTSIDKWTSQDTEPIEAYVSDRVKALGVELLGDRFLKFWDVVTDK